MTQTVDPPAGQGDDLLLTILIASRNRPGLVPRAVAAALAACPAHAEVLVIDDGSQPPAADALKDHLADPRVRIIVNTGPNGAASARNLGVARACGRVILFADDDDELMPHYARRVVEVAQGPARPAFGFSAVEAREQGRRLPPDKSRQGYGTGPLPPNAPLRHRINGLGTGFWVLRDRFLSAGGLDPDQKVDEDTGLCCALIAAGDQPWYEAEPGMIVHLGHSAAGASGGQLTRTTPPEVMAACYLRTWMRHERAFPPLSRERWFLGTRYLRRAVKAGQISEARTFSIAVRPWLFGSGFFGYWAIKAFAHKIRARLIAHSRHGWRKQDRR